MLPVPEKRSRAVASSKSMYCISTLKMFSLAKSVVGLALNDFGISKCRPLYFPVIILTIHYSLFTIYCSLFTSSSLDDERHQIIRHAFYLGNRRLLEIDSRIDGVCLLQIALQLLKQLLLLG